MTQIRLESYSAPEYSFLNVRSFINSHYLGHNRYGTPFHGSNYGKIISQGVALGWYMTPFQGSPPKSVIVIQLRFFLAAYLLINANFWKQAG